MGDLTPRLKVAIATPLSDELCELLVRLEPRLDLLCEQDLLPPMRWIGDHRGDPAFRRTQEQQARFDALLDAADAFYGIPDTTPAVLSQAVKRNPRLRWVHTMAAGGGSQVKAAGLSPADLERVVFTTSAGPHADSLAEFAVFGVYAGAKDLPRLHEQQQQRVWSNRWAMRQVSDMTVLVVGLGSIGRAVVNRFAGQAARVIAVNRSRKVVPGVSQVYLPEELEAAMAEADVIINTAPGTDRSNRMIGKAAFAAAKRGVIVVNVGRGSVIDGEALVLALQDGRVSFAALDVFDAEPLPHDSPLWAMDNVVISPHTAALTDSEDRLIAELFAANASALLDGTPLANIVNTVEFY